MKNIIFILLFICSSLLSSQSIIIPDFNGDQAFEYIKTQCDFGPRYPGSLGHQQLSDYLYDYFILNSDSVYIFDPL